MKTIVKILLGLLALIIIVIVVMLSYVKFGLPKVGDPPDLQVEITPERLERGEYLAWYGTGCLDCHTLRDPSVYSMPLMPGREGAGGLRFSHELGFPGVMYSPNITPACLGDWTDGEIFQAITAGVDNEGDALFPIMPYHDYAKMDKEDIYSIIAYIRTLEPIESQIPERELDFPLGLIVNLMPEEHELPEIRNGDLNTVMAWTLYGKMKEEDLRAIYRYIQTVQSLSNKVEKFTAP